VIPARQFVAFRRLRGNEDRRFRVNNVLLLAEERDRRSGGTGARCEEIIESRPLVDDIS
jgi:hypothetical protein